MSNMENGDGCLKTEEQWCMKFSAGEGKWKVCLTLVRLLFKDGIVAILVGGEKPHIGAIAIALPSKLAHQTDKTVISSSVFTVPGHMDDQIAIPSAVKMARELNEPAVVVAGLYIHKASKEDIDKLISSSDVVTNKALEELKRLHSCGHRKA